MADSNQATPQSTVIAPQNAQTPVPPSAWLGKWVREESFWREMTTRTLSGLLVAAVVALAAIFAGFGTHEQRMSILLSAGWSL